MFAVGTVDFGSLDIIAGDQHMIWMNGGFRHGWLLFVPTCHNAVARYRFRKISNRWS
jgi:hypothetical protein